VFAEPWEALGRERFPLSCQCIGRAKFPSVTRPAKRLLQPPTREVIFPLALTMRRELIEACVRGQSSGDTIAGKKSIRASPSGTRLSDSPWAFVPLPLLPGRPL
jgi:hypothetical protein